ncbi:peroxide stress protein YaaA [Caulobacter sp. S45]|uniref:peroxide stress protein YaaA n=1 Tax=Caulobacter sp. S45 TaxID=1641861 RepID=UPI00157657F8|nr:peroxide stress protein YaaA [Caulobacter sp. S45]
MLIALSPAKTLDLSPVPPDLPATRPLFAKDTAELARIARTLRRADLKRLMGISDKLADLNVERFHAFKAGARAVGVPAALAFAGDVYTGLKARELDGPALDWAQERLRILSGLYGLLRPLDMIQPYRLEMGIKLANPKGPDLYAFWREKVTKTLRKELKVHADPTLVNLASQEYFGAVDAKVLGRPLVSCAFKERAADGGVRMIALFAKRARGAMARYAIDHRVDRAEGLKDFDRDGYRFAPELSNASAWTFTRPAR